MIRPDRILFLLQKDLIVFMESPSCSAIEGNGTPASRIYVVPIMMSMRTATTTMSRMQNFFASPTQPALELSLPVLLCLLLPIDAAISPVVKSIAMNSTSVIRAESHPPSSAAKKAADDSGGGTDIFFHSIILPQIVTSTIFTERIIGLVLSVTAFHAR